MKETKEISAKEQLERLDEERKFLLEKVRVERKEVKEAHKNFLKERNQNIQKTLNVLRNIQKEIYKYNRLSKTLKSQSNILSEIALVLNAEEEGTLSVEELI